MPNVVTIQQPFCADVGVSSIPLEPNAISTPPLIVNAPSKSSAVSPSLVGPITVTLPPFITILPFESRPSPPAFTNIFPPLIVSKTLLSEDDA